MENKTIPITTEKQISDAIQQRNEWQAKQWWNQLSFEEKFYKVIPWLKEQNINVTERHPDTLTGYEIEMIWRKETNN